MASRALRLLYELCDILELFSADNTSKNVVTNRIAASRNSTYAETKALLSTRRLITTEMKPRRLAISLWESIHNRLRPLYEPIAICYMISNAMGVEEEMRKRMRKSKQALMLHSASALNINECTMDWFRKPEHVSDYVQMLVNVIVSELTYLLGSSAEELVQTSSMTSQIHQQMKKNFL